jgi:hypothetical protein
MKEILFYDYAVTVPDNWFDITWDLDGDPPSDTVAPKGGVGRLQFQFYLPAATDSPVAALEELRTLLPRFAKRHHLGKPHDLTATASPRPLVAASYHGGSEFIRVCFLVDEGRQVEALYICEHEQNHTKELAEAVEIVRSLRFTEPPNESFVLNPKRM